MPGYRFTPETKSVILPVQPPAMYQEVLNDLLSLDFELKNEHHVTVLPIDTGTELTRRQYQRFTAHLGKLAVPQLAYVDELWHISKPKQINNVLYQRESLVAPVVSTGLSSAFHEAAEEAGVELELPFFHVTLATRPDADYARRGIAITSAEQWDDLSKYLFAEGWQR